MNFYSLLHSVFLQALGSAIINSIWQAFLCWFLFEIIAVSYKNSSARFKNNLSTSLLLISFVWFLKSFIFSVINNSSNIDASFISNFPEIKSAPHSFFSTRELLLYAGNGLPYLSIAYIFLLFLLMFKLFYAYRYVFYISNNKIESPSLALQTFVDDVAKQTGISRKISLWISHHIDVPATIGFIKPIILIPIASINNLSGEQLEAILLHEISHIKRNDFIVNLFTSVIETILFFNPFVVLLSKIIKRERENCCDDFVLQYRYNPHAYASALLKLEQNRVSTLKLGLGAVSGKKQLLSRIKRIIQGNTEIKQFNYVQKLIALLLVTAIIFSISWLTPPQNKQVYELVSETESHLTGNIAQTNSKRIQVEKIEIAAPKISSGRSSKNEAASLSKIPENDWMFPKEKPLPGMDDVSSIFNQNDIATGNDQFHPLFNFNGPEIKLPSSIKIHNIPFFNNSFNIDLSKIDLKELNNNLQLAYKELNAVNWREIQKKIGESIAKEKLQNLISKEMESEMEKININFDQPQEMAPESKNDLVELKRKITIMKDSLQSKEIQIVAGKRSGLQEQINLIQGLLKNQLLNNNVGPSLIPPIHLHEKENHNKKVVGSTQFKIAYKKNGKNLQFTLDENASVNADAGQGKNSFTIELNDLQ